VIHVTDNTGLTWYLHLIDPLNQYPAGRLATDQARCTCFASITEGP